MRGFLGVCLRKDVLRMLRDPLGLVISIGIPIVVVVLLRTAFGGGGATPTAHLLVADHDDGFLSKLLVGAFGQGELGELVTTEEVTEEDGRARMNEGGASGLLVIPDGFTAAVLRSDSTSLTLITNPAQNILPGILEGALEFMIDAASGAQQVLGGMLDRMAEEPPEGMVTHPDETVISISVAINQLVARAEPYVFPPAIKLETVVLKEEKENDLNFADIFFPSMLFMAIIFAAQSFSDDLWKERTQGTLRRFVTVPQSLATLLAGKVLAIGLFLAVVGAAGLLLGKAFFSVSLANLPLAVAWVTLSGVFMLLLFMILNLFARSQRGGNLLSTMVVFPLIMLGGAFFPFEAMPDWLARIGRATPNGWALEQFRRIIWDTFDPATLAVTAAALVGLGALLYVAGLARLQSFSRG